MERQHYVTIVKENSALREVGSEGEGEGGRREGIEGKEVWKGEI